MKAPSLLILVVLQLSKIADCCSSPINLAVDNAFVSCSTNVSCKAECYRGYIFPSGSTTESYSCQNGAWTPDLSSCKRIPLVSVTYSAGWTFSEVLVCKCENISSRLHSLAEMLEQKLTNNCIPLNANATVQLTYSFLAFQVHTDFKAVYYNFTNWKTLDVCIKYNLQAFHNHQVIKSMFDGITCGNSSTSNTIHKDLVVKEMYDICPSATELHSVTTSEDEMYIRYCDITGTDSTMKSTKLTTETTRMSTSESPTLKTEVSLTGNTFNISQSTPLEYEENSNISQGTTLKIEVSSNDETNVSRSTIFRTEVSSKDQNSNISQGTTITEFSSKMDLNVKSIVYIAVPAGGAFLIFLIIILIVCLRKRVKNSENLTDNIKMKRKTNERKDETSFKGDMIENELYNSADDMLDCDSNEDNTTASTGDCSAAPYSKKKTEKELKVDDDEYSYPSKISKFKDARLNIAFNNDTDGDLDVKERDIFQSPNYDSEKFCQYAVVNKSRKL